VGLCFLLPFVTASCTAGTGLESTSATATYDGFDLALGGSPDFTVESATPQGSVTAEAQLRDRVGPIDLQPLAVLTFVLLVAGAAASVIRATWIRTIAGAALAVGAAVFLTGAALDSRGDIRDDLGRRFTTFTGRRPGPADFAVDLAYGFWIALVLLIVVAAVNIAALVLARTGEPGQPGPGGPPGSGPESFR
jgi:hypothetical protein